MDFTLTNGQKQALELLQDWFKKGDRQVFRLSGYAGSGKSYTITKMQDLLGVSLAYVAYTGKASLVLRRRGLPACTIHRLIYEVDKSSKKLKFIKKKFLDVDPDVIVIDEASMVDEKCFQDLCSFGKMIIVVGDPGQLPPVQGKSTCLQDPDIVLTEIVRQALDNPIISLATDIRQGRQLQLGMYKGQIPIGDYSKLNEDFFLKPDQVLCATNKTRTEINQRVRQFKGFYDRLPVVGDKLISLRNLWGFVIGGNVIVNGTTGIVRRIISKSNSYTRILFQPDGVDDCGVVDIENCRFFGVEPEYKEPTSDIPVGDFDFGYCLTTHKSQGSGFPKVLGVVENWPFGEDRKKLLYTMVTRAEQRLALAIK